MKRILVYALFIGFISSIYGQSKEEKQRITVSGGPLVEMNVSGFIHSGFSDGSSRMRIGITVGGFVKLSVSRYFSVQGEMAFMQKHSDFYWEGEGGCYCYCGVEIPIYAMYSYQFSNGGGMHIGIGPYTNFGLGATFKNGNGRLDLYEKNAETGLPSMKDSDTGFGIKAGYEFPCGLQVNISYKTSVSNLIDSNSNHVKMYPQAAIFGFAWRFGK